MPLPDHFWDAEPGPEPEPPDTAPEPPEASTKLTWKGLIKNWKAYPVPPAILAPKFKIEMLKNRPLTEEAIVPEFSDFLNVRMTPRMTPAYETSLTYSIPAASTSSTNTNEPLTFESLEAAVNALKARETKVT